MSKWVDIPGYNGMYQVNGVGEIKSFMKDPKGRVKVLRLRKDGYLQTQNSSTGLY